MPVAEWLEEGAQLSAGSDCNIAPYDPMLSIWGLATRRTRSAGTRGEASRVSRRVAFMLYTSASAAACGDADWRGSIAKGYAADLIAIDRDPFTCDIDELPRIAVHMTLVNGQTVFNPEAR